MSETATELFDRKMNALWCQARLFVKLKIIGRVFVAGVDFFKTGFCRS